MKKDKGWILEIINENGINSKIEFQNKKQLKFYLKAMGRPLGFIPCRRRSEKGELEVIRNNDWK